MLGNVFFSIFSTKIPEDNFYLDFYVNTLNSLSNPDIAGIALFCYLTGCMPQGSTYVEKNPKTSFTNYHNKIKIISTLVLMFF